VSRLSEFFRNPFSFLTASKGAEDRVAAYIIREHERGRSLGDILDDPYVINRCSEQEIRRVVERPEVVNALGDDIAQARAGVGGQSSS
jgi:hypothetical protein